jgi:hypothetical protein
VIVERMIRTWRMYMARYLHAYPEKRWTDALDDLEISYNSSFHNSIQMTPDEASLKVNEGLVWNALYSKYLFLKKGKAKFKLGDKVRISRYKIIFSKESERNWSTEIFVVSEVSPTVPVFTYFLKDQAGEILSGRFYAEELQRVEE